MDFHDLDQARAIHGALLEVLAAHSGGRSNPVALNAINTLVNAGIHALDDMECRVALRGVKSYGALLFSDDGHLGLGSEGLSALDLLRMRIANELSAFRGRLAKIEAERLLQQRTEFELRRRERMEPPALTVESSYSTSGQRGVRVLVIEDNRDSAESLRRLLYHSGYEVAVAFTGQAGLRVAKMMRPEVILCDIGLPDSNGFIVAQALREEPETMAARLIAVTAYGQDEDRRRAVEAGFDLHLVKPVDPQMLLAKLQVPGPSPVVPSSPQPGID
jgi:CheY-like chemotaxis protein